MPRESVAQLKIPATGSDSVPYPDFRQLLQGNLLHGVEAFVAEVLGAGGVGGTFVCPFEPAFVLISEVTGPLIQAQFPGSSGTVGINLVDGTAAAADATYTAVDVDDKSQGFTIALPTGVAPDGDTATVLCFGFRDAGDAALGGDASL